MGTKRQGPVALLRRETGTEKNVTRQPKSCYATADLLTHICNRGAGETGAKCPAAHSRRAGSPSQKGQEQHPAEPVTHPTPSRAAALAQT